MDAYTLKKMKDTAEYRLFQGIMNNEGGCTSGSKSICQRTEKTESEKNIFSWKDEKEARKLCAEIGRKVCGTCVSHLYLTQI